MDSLAASKPLSDLRVLDLSQGIAGPHCGGLFAEFGARVIKIEPPKGDWMRELGAGFDGLSASFLYYNRGKESLALDLKNKSMLDVALQLAGQSDVVIDNNRPGVSDRLGIGFEALKTRNPRIVLVAISGFGQTGPKAEEPLTDAIAQAATGLMSINRGRANMPAKIDTTIVDALTGLYAFQAATMALWGDAAKRHAQKLDVSLASSAAAIQGPKILEFAALGAMPQRMNPPAGSYKASDGWLAVALLRESEWPRVCKVLDRLDLAEDLRFTTFASRAQNEPALIEIIDSIIVTCTVGEWVARFQAENILAGPINDYEDFLSDTQTVASRIAPQQAIASASNAPVARTPAQAPNDALSPRLGEHSRNILSELGFTGTNIDAFVAEGAIVSPIPSPSPV